MQELTLRSVKKGRVYEGDKKRGDITDYIKEPYGTDQYEKGRDQEHEGVVQDLLLVRVMKIKGLHNHYFTPLCLRFPLGQSPKLHA
jgi:hypothetical protein